MQQCTLVYWQPFKPQTKLYFSCTLSAARCESFPFCRQYAAVGGRHLCRHPALSAAECRHSNTLHTPDMTAGQTHICTIHNQRYLQTTTSTGLLIFIIFTLDWSHNFWEKITIYEAQTVNVLWESEMIKIKHVNNMVKTCNFHLQALRHVRQSITHDVANAMACAIFGSCLDYCNSMFTTSHEKKLW